MVHHLSQALTMVEQYRKPIRYVHHPDELDGELCPKCQEDSIQETSVGVKCERCGWEKTKEEIEQEKDNNTP